MPLEFCPACTKRISVDATSCPKCGHPLPEGWAEVEKAKRRKIVLYGFLGIVVLALAISLGAQLFDSGSDPCGERDRAFFEAKQFVTARLKSPRSASFPMNFQANVAMKSCGLWLIGSYVDSRNSFGAKIRTRFLATVERLSDGTWKLVDLTFVR